MAIIKQAKNLYSQIAEEYTAIVGNFTEISEEIVVDSSEENMSLISNKKIVAKGIEQSE
jgi:hypothetical protein